MPAPVDSVTRHNPPAHGGGRPQSRSAGRAAGNGRPSRAHPRATRGRTLAKPGDIPCAPSTTRDSGPPGCGRNAPPPGPVPACPDPGPVPPPPGNMAANPRSPACPRECRDCRQSASRNVACQATAGGIAARPGSRKRRHNAPGGREMSHIGRERATLGRGACRGAAQNGQGHGTEERAAGHPRGPQPKTPRSTEKTSEKSWISPLKRDLWSGAPGGKASARQISVCAGSCSVAVS